MCFLSKVNDNKKGRSRERERERKKERKERTSKGRNVGWEGEGRRVKRGNGSSKEGESSHYIWTHIPSGMKTVDKFGSVLSLKYVSHTGIEYLGQRVGREYKEKRSRSLLSKCFSTHKFRCDHISTTLSKAYNQ